MIKTRPYHELLIESLADIEECRQYLLVALEDYPEGFLKALRNIVEAQKAQHPEVWEGADREALYQRLFAEESPSLAVVSAVLKLVGLKLSVESTDSSALPMLLPEGEFQHVS